MRRTAWIAVCLYRAVFAIFFLSLAQLGFGSYLEESPGRVLPGRSEQSPSPRYRPTSEYEIRHMLGWKLYVAPDLLEDTRLAEKVVAELRRQLEQIRTVLPNAVLQKLVNVPIWIEKEEGHHPCMAYHPNPDWLRNHDMNPDKAKCVEIAGARNFVAWTRAQPWMVLHELAHAYHDQFLPGGFRNREILQRFEEVKAETLYQKVRHVNGREQRAYALKDVTEFFAETSEAFFGKNDFFPFTREELREYDPKTHELLARIWQIEEKEGPTTASDATAQSVDAESGLSHGSQPPVATEKE